MSTLVKILRPDLYKPEDIKPATLYSAGLDLRLAQPRSVNVQLVREGRAYPHNDLLGTGLSVAIPPGYVGLLLPRSSAGHKKGFRLGNTVGVIDSDYRGELKLSVPQDAGELREGDTLAQLLVVPADTSFKVVDELPDTARGDGGFGSTDGIRFEEMGASPAYDQCHNGPDEDDLDEEDFELECPYCPWHGHQSELVRNADGEYLCPDCLAILSKKENDDEQ